MIRLHSPGRSPLLCRCGAPMCPIFEYACHEGNYGMMNLLSGARASETTGR